MLLGLRGRDRLDPEVLDAKVHEVHGDQHRGFDRGAHTHDGGAELLRAELADNPNVLAIRGQGLMIGIELKQPIRDLTLIAARDHGLLINVTRGKTVRLLPPLTIDEREVGMIVRGVALAVSPD